MCSDLLDSKRTNLVIHETAKGVFVGKRSSIEVSNGVYSHLICVDIRTASRVQECPACWDSCASALHSVDALQPRRRWSCCSGACTAGRHRPQRQMPCPAARTASLRRTLRYTCCRVVHRRRCPPHSHSSTWQVIK